MTSYRTVLIPEMNTGQLSMLIRAKFLVDAISFTKVQGIPIAADVLRHTRRHKATCASNLSCDLLGKLAPQVGFVPAGAERSEAPRA